MVDRSDTPSGIHLGWAPPLEIPAPGVRGLTDAERAEAGQVARRVHAELRGVVNLLPPADRGASAMSRLLGLDRATCQRIVATIAKSDADASTLINLPGVLGLRQFVDAVAKRGGPSHEQLAGAAAAIERVETLIDELGGSQRKLRERLTAPPIRPGADPSQVVGSDDLGIREALFRAAAATVGRWCETLVAMRIVRPVPGNPRQTEEAVVRAMIGHRARIDAVPLIAGIEAAQPVSAAENGGLATLDSKPASGMSQGSLLASFCSQPMPRVVARSAGSRVVQVVDTREHGPERAADIVIANKWDRPEEHPATKRPAIGEIWSLMTFPAQRLLFDVYLHKEIARRCLPSLELHLWGPDVGRQGATRWSTQFPGGPRLELLGPGLSAASSGAYRRHRELTSHLFEQLGWGPDEFVGYRCETVFPVWRAGYCMVFDFTGNEIE